MSKRYKARLLEREEIFSKFCSPKKKAWLCNLPYKHFCSHWSKSIFLLHHVTAFEIHNRNKFHHHMIKVCLFLCFSDWFGVPAVSSWWRKWTGEASVKILMCFILMYFVFCTLYCNNICSLQMLVVMPGFSFYWPDWNRRYANMLQYFI